MELVFIVLGVSLLTVVQSIVGIGVLMIGTPVAIVLGYDYWVALPWLLLPSMAISISQILEDSRGQRDEFKSYLLLLTPGVILSAGVASELFASVPIEFVISAVVFLGLVFSGVRRKKGSEIPRPSSKLDKVALASIGILHGFSNLGGAILATYARFARTEKVARRRMVAWAYLILSGSQLTAVLILHPEHFIDGLLPGLISAVAASFVFWLVGNRLFVSLSSTRADSVSDLVMVIILLVLLARGFGIIGG